MISFCWKRCSLLAACLLLFTAGFVRAEDKPNILVIWGDDIGYWNLSAYNHGMMGTMERGMELEATTEFNIRDTEERITKFGKKS